jgi:hypothetical protein
MMRLSQTWDKVVVNAIHNIRGKSPPSLSVETVSVPPHSAPNFEGASHVRCYRSAAGRHQIIALTNNYAAVDGVEPSELEFLGWTEGATPPALRALFDDYCDSSTLGMR